MKAKVKVFCRFQHDWNVQEIEKIEKIVHTISNNPTVEVFLLLY